MFVKLEKRQITQRKDGAIYKTKKLGHAWFPVSAQPVRDSIDSSDCFWCSTSDVCFDTKLPAQLGEVGQLQ